MAVIEGAWVAGSVVSVIAIGAVGCCCGGQQQQQQQQQVVLGSEEESKRVCPECGIENPRDVDYCGDCGFSFRSGNGDEDE
jgi:rubredoxin